MCLLLCVGWSWDHDDKRRESSHSFVWRGNDIRAPAMTCSAALLPAEGNLSSALCGAALSYAHCAAKCQVAPCQEQTAAICGKGEETVLDVRAAPHTLNTSCVICWCACVDGVTRPSQSLITEQPFPNMHRVTVVVCILSIHLIHIKSMSS